MWFDLHIANHIASLFIDFCNFIAAKAELTESYGLWSLTTFQPDLIPYSMGLLKVGCFYKTQVECSFISIS